MANINTERLCSIIIPVYNKQKYLPETLDCLKYQTHTHWEAILIDDYSNDNSWRIIMEFAKKDSRFKPFRLEQNQGAQYVRNMGIDKSSGDYIIFLDADDILTDSSLKKRVKYLENNNNIDFVVSGAGLLKNGGRTKKSKFNLKKKSFNADLDAFLTDDVPWLIMQPTWRKKTIEKIGNWDVNLISLQDRDYNIRALCLDLKYSKHLHVDCYWRRDDEYAISRNLFKKHVLNSHEYFFNKIHDLLKKQNKLTTRRKNYLAGRYLWLAKLNVRIKGHKRGAIKFWKKTWEKNLVNFYVYGLVKIYFFISGKDVIRDVYVKFFGLHIYKTLHIKIDSI